MGVVADSHDQIPLLDRFGQTMGAGSVQAKPVTAPHLDCSWVDGAGRVGSGACGGDVADKVPGLCRQL
jgi:hypothetical protein